MFKQKLPQNKTRVHIMLMNGSASAARFQCMGVWVCVQLEPAPAPAPAPAPPPAPEAGTGGGDTGTLASLVSSRAAARAAATKAATVEREEAASTTTACRTGKGSHCSSALRDRRGWSLTNCDGGVAGEVSERYCSKLRNGSVRQTHSFETQQSLPGTLHRRVLLLHAQAVKGRAPHELL